jgi:hypothetical protein
VPELVAEVGEGTVHVTDHVEAAHAVILAAGAVSVLGAPPWRVTPPIA